jgi:hypothetical protein
LALAVIGLLPMPVLQRSIVLHMERCPATVKLERFDPKTNLVQQQNCDIVYREVFDWSRHCTLNPDPQMPPQLRNRVGDNWRVLISIADACNPAWGKAAREAAVELSKGQDEDLAVLLLTDIREIFDRHPTTDRLASKRIITELIELPNGLWSEWRGPRNEQMPRALTQGGLAQMLSIFRPSIRSKTIWPPRRGTAGKSAKGYFRKDFEAAWAAYCAEDGTPAQPNNIRYLRKKEGGK